jgi:hypothetical protein
MRLLSIVRAVLRAVFRRREAGLCVSQQTVRAVVRYEQTRGVDQVCWPKGGPKA